MAPSVQWPPALTHRNYRLFFAGQFVSLIGTWMQSVAQGWLVFTLTHSAFMLGAVAAVGSLPTLFLTMWGGVIADQHGKRKILVFTQSASMVLALALWGLTATGLVQVWHVAVLAALLSVVNSLDMPTRQAFTIELVGRDDLMSGIALNSSVFNATRVLGPAVAGIIVAWWGTATCFLLNGISYVAVIAGLMLMQVDDHPRTHGNGSPMHMLLEGLRYIRRTRPVLDLVLLLGVTSLFGWSYSTLLPLFADEYLHAGPQGYGFLMAATGAGAVIGALMLSMDTQTRTPVRRLRAVGGIAIFSATLLCFAWSKFLPWSLVLMAAGGWAMITYFATSNTWLQHLVPNQLRGRVMGVYNGMFQGLTPVGGFLVGALAQHAGTPWAFTAGAVACGLAAVVAWRRRVGAGTATILREQAVPEV